MVFQSFVFNFVGMNDNVRPLAIGAAAAGANVLKHGYDSIFGETINKSDPDGPPAKVGSASGSAWAPGGAGAPVGSILQNQQWSHSTGVATKKFKSTGGFFFVDASSPNNWTNVPWEFARMWIYNSELFRVARKYRYWRTKSVRMTFKQPTQLFTYALGTGMTAAGHDQNAQLCVHVDRECDMGTTKFVGWTFDQYKNFAESFSTNGFSDQTNAAVPLPNVVNMSFNPLNSKQPEEWKTESGSNTERLGCNAGTCLMREHHPSNKHWRLCTELLYDIGQASLYNSSQCYSSGPPQPSATDLTDYIAVFRADNFSTRLFCPGTNMLCHESPTVGDVFKRQEQYMTIEHPWMQWAGQGLSGTATQNSDSTLAEYRAALFQPQGSNVGNMFKSNDALARMNENFEEDPIPQMWICVKNMVGQDGSSLKKQYIQIECEYEWELEFGGFKKAEIGLNYQRGVITGTQRNFFNPNIGYTTMWNRPVCLPFYFMQTYNGEQCDSDDSGPFGLYSPARNAFTAKNMLNYRRIKADT